jgi:ADP-ribosylglycohydrolase
MRLPRIPTDEVKRNRFRGCLLGGAVGDALGAPVEFMSRQEIRKRFGVVGIRDFVPGYGVLGAITDDTQMTLFTAEGMLRANVRERVKGIPANYVTVLSRAYLRWLVTQGYESAALEKETVSGWLIKHRELFSRRAPGLTCLQALRQMEHVGDLAKNDSKGCGGVMRAAPVGMFAANWINQGGSDDEILRAVFKHAAGSAALTHGHPTGQLTAGVFAQIIALVLTGTSLQDAIEKAKDELRQHDRHDETLVAIEEAQQLAAEARRKKAPVSELGEGWVAEEALAISLYCVLVSDDLESGVTFAVNHSGDSDSTGAITGNLLGAMLGVDAIPPRWLKQLELHDVIRAVADDLATVREWDVAGYLYENTEESDFYFERYPGW